MIADKKLELLNTTSPQIPKNTPHKNHPDPPKTTVVLEGSEWVVRFSKFLGRFGKVLVGFGTAWVYRYSQSGAGPGRAPDWSGKEISGPKGPEISLPERSGARAGPAPDWLYPGQTPSVALR